MSGIDEEKAKAMLGKLVLSGVSYYDIEGNVLRHQQFFGTVLRISIEEGLVLADGTDGSEIHLPHSLEHYMAAAPGTYTLKSVNQCVVDPDYISTWHVHPSTDQVHDLNG